MIQEGIAGLTRNLGENHLHSLIAKNDLGALYFSTGRLDRSVPLFEELVLAMKTALGTDHPETIKTGQNLAIDYAFAGRFAEAERVIDEWLPRARAKFGIDHPNVQFGMDTALNIYAEVNKPAKAEPLLRDLVEYWKQAAGADSLKYAMYLGGLGTSLVLQGNGTEAEPVLREAMAICQKQEPAGWTLSKTQSLLGASLLLQKKYADAEPHLLQGCEGMKRLETHLPPFAKRHLIETMERLVQLYDAWGKKDKADEWRKQLEAWNKGSGLQKQ